MLIPSQAWAEGKHQRDATGHVVDVWAFPFGNGAACLGDWAYMGEGY